MKKIILLSLVPLTLTASVTTKKALQGTWKLTGLSCNGVKQTIDKDYTLSFENEKGTYTSKTSACTQYEPEIYNYVGDGKVSIKSGVRTCAPNPCEADLPSDQCGKETNVNTPVFDVTVKGKTMTLSTSDPKSIDCTSPGQQKPAIFTFAKLH